MLSPPGVDRCCRQEKMLFASRTLSPLQSKASALPWCQGGISGESNAGELMGDRERELGSA